MNTSKSQRPPIGESDVNMRSLEKLMRITQDCRNNMHEPDEQDLVASVHYGKETFVGHFDNAMGTTIGEKAVFKHIGGTEHTTGELVVEIENEFTGEQVLVNLADLVAMARFAYAQHCPDWRDELTVTNATK